MVNVQPLGVWIGHEEVVVLVRLLACIRTRHVDAPLPNCQIQTSLATNECLRVTFEQPTKKQLKAAKLGAGAGSRCVVA